MIKEGQTVHTIALEKDRQTDKQTNSQTDKQTNRQTDNQANTHQTELRLQIFCYTYKKPVIFDDVDPDPTGKNYKRKCNPRSILTPLCRKHS